MKKNRNKNHIPGDADVPPNPEAVKIIECGCCCQYHRTDFHGDCRNDAERFADAEDAETKIGKPVVEVDTEAPFIPDVGLFPLNKDLLQAPKENIVRAFAALDVTK